MRDPPSSHVSHVSDACDLLSAGLSVRSWLVCIPLLVDVITSSRVSRHSCHLSGRPNEHLDSALAARGPANDTTAAARDVAGCLRVIHPARGPGGVPQRPLFAAEARRAVR